MEDLKHASTFHKIIEDACIAEARLKDLGIFEHVKLAIASGPRELPGTVNVVYSGLEPEKLREVNVSVSTKLGVISVSLSLLILVLCCAVLYTLFEDTCVQTKIFFFVKENLVSV